LVEQLTTTTPESPVSWGFMKTSIKL